MDDFEYLEFEHDEDEIQLNQTENNNNFANTFPYSLYDLGMSWRDFV